MNIAKLMTTHQAVCIHLWACQQENAMAHLVIPEARADRVPYIEIRFVRSMEKDLEEIEQKWPDIEFESIATDEEGL